MIVMWLYGCRWLKWDLIPFRDVIRVAHLGIGHVDSVVGSGIDVMYSNLLGVFVDLLGYNCVGVGLGFGSSLWTCLRWLIRLPCCMVLSH